MRVEQKPVPNCPSRRPGQSGTGFCTRFRAQTGTKPNQNRPLLIKGVGVLVRPLMSDEECPPDIIGCRIPQDADYRQEVKGKRPQKSVWRKTSQWVGWLPGALLERGGGGGVKYRKPKVFDRIWGSGASRGLLPRPPHLRGYKLGYRSGYKSLSRVTSGVTRGLSRYKCGLIPTEAPYTTTYNPT